MIAGTDTKANAKAEVERGIAQQAADDEAMHQRERLGRPWFVDDGRPRLRCGTRRGAAVLGR
jgi:hypothetical protein